MATIQDNLRKRARALLEDGSVYAVVALKIKPLPLYALPLMIPIALFSTNTATTPCRNTCKI